MTSTASVSWFGEYIAFVSDASDLVAGDNNGAPDVFVRNRRTGSTRRVSVTSAGAEAMGGSGRGPFGERGLAMSGDGRLVLFSSNARNLDAGKNSDFYDIFLHDRDTDNDGVLDEPGAISTRRISVDSAGGDPNGDSYAPSMDVSVQNIAFASRATDLIANDNNTYTDIFLYAGGITRRLSQIADDTGGNGASRDPIVVRTAQGVEVVFTSDATNLIGLNQDNNNQSDAFVWRYIGQGGIIRVSVAPDGSELSGASEATSATPSGRMLIVFTCSADVSGTGDGNMVADVFIRDRDTDVDGILDEAGQVTTYRASLPNGSFADPDGPSGGGSIDFYGRFVAFESAAGNLVSGDPGGSNYNVFLRDLQTGQTRAAGVLPGGGEAFIGPGINEVSISPEGGTVAFGNYGDTPQQVYLRDTQALDTDSDGLLDTWEVVGIDANADGALDLTLPQARAFVKDDSMLGMLPSPSTLAAIDRAFTGMDGVGADLHLFDGGDQGVPQATWSGNLTTWPPEFAGFKTAYFGTLAERSSANWPNIRAAKLLAHRYFVFAFGNAGNTLAGMGEMPGNDGFESLGAWPAWGSAPSTQAGVFMHELGHMLGLDHGGGMGIANAALRPTKFKPNYHSNVNGTWTTPQTGYASSWFLGFSSYQMNSLWEWALDEQAGVGGFPGFVVPVGPMPWRLANMNGAVDFNRDATITGTMCPPCCPPGCPPFVQADINQVTTFQPPYAQDQLEPHVDWPNLWWRLSGNINFNASVHGETFPAGEFTYETFLALEQAGHWTDSFDTYAPGTALNIIGGWETWCEGGADAHADPIIFRSPPGSLGIFFDGSSQYGSDVVKRFNYESGRFILTAWTFVPGFATGSGYIVMLNEYCAPSHNWSMQVEFDADAGVVRDFRGAVLPLVRDQWVEFRAEIDLNADRLTEFYGGQVLAADLVWSQNVSGFFGDPGITSIAALDLFSENIPEMFFDDLSMEVIACPPDVNGDGVVNSQDFFDFLAAFFAGEAAADYNGDGAVNSQDFFDFLAGFFVGCV